MGPDLMAEMRAQAERFGAEIVAGHVTRGRSRRRARSSSGYDDTEIRARTLIIATGASARLLGLPSERALMGHGVSTCATCDGYFFRGQPIAVVGGGDTAMEEAHLPDALRLARSRVVHRRDTLRASKVMQDKALAQPEDRSGAGTPRSSASLDEGKGEVTGVVLRDLVDRRDVASSPVDGVFVAIGHTPNTSLFAGQLEMDANGYLITHDGAEDLGPRRVRLRRRAGSRLSAGDHRGRLRLHGRDRRAALPRGHRATSETPPAAIGAGSRARSTRRRGPRRRRRRRRPGRARWPAAARRTSNARAAVAERRHHAAAPRRADSGSAPAPGAAGRRRAGNPVHLAGRRASSARAPRAARR